MALDDTDRRRFILATIVSLLALPALWWANRDEGTAGPNVATAGVEIGAGNTTGASDGIPGVATTIGGSNLPDDQTIGSSAPVFLDGPVPNPAAVSEIAVPSGSSADSIITEATYRSSIADSGTCLARSIQPGRTIIVVNLDNNRTITCAVRLAPATQIAELVIHTDQFIRLADLTDAPIPVEIRQ